MEKKQRFYLNYFFSFQLFTLLITFFDLSSHEYLSARFEELLDNLSFKSLFPIKNSILSARLSGLSGSKSKQFTSFSSISVFDEIFEAIIGFPTERYSNNFIADVYSFDLISLAVAGSKRISELFNNSGTLE
jgi:hypothetical protein